MIVDSHGRPNTAYSKTNGVVVLTDAAILNQYKKDRMVAEEMSALRQQIAELQRLVVGLGINKDNSELQINRDDK